MKVILKTTGVLLIALALLGLIVGTIEADIYFGIYMVVLGLPVFAVPMILAIAVYHFLVAKKFSAHTRLVRFLLRSLSIFGLIILAMILWGTAEYIIMNSWNVDFHKIVQNYHREIPGFLWLSLIFSFSLEIVHHVFACRAQTTDTR